MKGEPDGVVWERVVGEPVVKLLMAGILHHPSSRKSQEVDCLRNLEWCRLSFSNGIRYSKKSTVPSCCGNNPSLCGARAGLLVT